MTTENQHKDRSQMTIRIARDTNEKLAERAKKEKRTKNAVVEIAIENHLDRGEQN